MAGFFSKARKAVTTFVGAFIAAVWTATQNGTVFGPKGINWATVVTAAGLALAAAVATWAVPPNKPAPAEAARSGFSDVV